MELQPPTAPLPPFWAAVRRRHPDADIVVLPDAPPDPVAGAVDEVDDGVVRRALERVDTTADELGADPPAKARLGYGPDPGTVLARVRLASHREDGPATLNRLRDRLAERGWDVRRTEGGVARLVGHRDDLHVRASWAEATGAFLLDVSTDPLPVGNERARELVSG